MTFTRLIGEICGAIVDRIVRWLALSRIHPNVLTFLGLVINAWAAFLFAEGRFRAAAAVVIGAGLFDMWTAAWLALPIGSRNSAVSSIPY